MALLIFMAVGLLLVAGFLAYQLALVASGTTTYETYKWREVARRMAAERCTDGEGGTTDGAPKGTGRRWLLPWRDGSSPQPPLAVQPVNIYDRGMRANFAEALFPPAWAVQSAGTLGTAKKQN